MTDEQSKLRRKLIRAFRDVFDDRLPEDIPAATMESVEGWDSMATWNLLMVVEETVGVRIGLDQIPVLTSFAAFEVFVGRKLGLA